MSLVCAIYARKSTEQSVADEQKSVARQVDHARQYAARKGWTVDEASIFVDDGVSGAEFASRPGFVRLMAALKPRPRFQVLVMSEESRLGREMVATMAALKELVSAGVRVFYYLDDKERTIDSPIEKAIMALETFGAELERAKASQRSTDKALQLLRAGHVTGGRVFGYDNVRVDSHTERRINEAEAAIVRRIFELAAAGVGQKRIAVQLNVEGAPSPRAQRERPQSWAPSSVHEVLFRELYRGEIVWNRTRKRDRWGQHRQTARPADAWMRVAAPALRIVDEALWQAAHARIAEARGLYRTATKGLRGGRPRIESKYLLTGLARCTVCGGGVQVRTGSHGSGTNRWRVYAYGCSSHQNRGVDVCRNHLRVPMAEVDRAVLDSIGEILTPDLVDDVVARARELFEHPTESDDERSHLEVELRAAEDRVDRYALAIGEAGDVPAVTRLLRDAEKRRQEAVAALQALGAAEPSPRVDWRLVERQARQKMAEWRALLARQVAEGRQLLKMILGGGWLHVTPIRENGRSGFKIEGLALLGGLLEGVAFMQKEPRRNWRPQFQRVGTSSAGG